MIKARAEEKEAKARADLAFKKMKQEIKERGQENVRKMNQIERQKIQTEILKSAKEAKQAADQLLAYERKAKAAAEAWKIKMQEAREKV